MRRLLFSVPDGQRYSCRHCTWCCRWWRIEVDPAARDRLLAHDWAAESPRLRGVSLFEEQLLSDRADPVIQTAQIDGKCVFLEEDGLCLIHKVLGPDAKPMVCQGFPLVLGRTVDGVLVGASYGCSAVVRSEGEPFARQEPLVLELLDRSEEEALGGNVVMDPEPLLAGSTRLSWRAYLELERSLLEILGRGSLPVSYRVAAAAELVLALALGSAGRDRVGEDEVRAWLEERRERGYSDAFAGAAAISASPIARRALLAPLIAEAETASMGSSPDRGPRSLAYAEAIVKGEGTMSLSTLEGSVDLAALRRVRYDPDKAPFDGYLTRFLSNFVMRKSLLESPDLKEGVHRLSLYFALVRWYAATSATLAGRPEVGEEDVVVGIQVAEKAYVHGIVV